jgi:hypothetical protein
MGTIIATIGGIVLIVFCLGIVSNILNKRFLFFYIPLILLICAFATYKLITKLSASKNVLNNKEIIANAQKEWERKNPDAFTLYKELKFRESYELCIVCGKKATIGCISYPKGTVPPTDLHSERGIVCSEHDQFLEYWINFKDELTLEYYRLNYQGELFNSLSNDKLYNISDSTLNILLNSNIHIGSRVEENFPIYKFVKVIPKSKEDFYESAGFYIGILLGCIIFSILYFKEMMLDS